MTNSGKNGSGPARREVKLHKFRKERKRASSTGGETSLFQLSAERTGQVRAGGGGRVDDDGGMDGRPDRAACL